MEPDAPLWSSREEAGRLLASRCRDLRGGANTLLLALPRGGVAVGAAMAAELDLPLATWSVRKRPIPNGPRWR